MSFNTANQANMANAVSQFFKAQGNGADAYALGRNFESWLSDQYPTAWDYLDMAVNLAKIVENWIALAREVPVIGSALNAGSLVLSTKKLNDALTDAGIDDIENVKAALAGITSDICAIASGVLIVGVAGVSAPVTITLAGLAALFSVGFSLYSSTAGAETQAKRDALLKWSYSQLDGLSAYGSFTWNEADGRLFNEKYKKDPVLGPALIALHAIDPSLSVDQADALISASGVSSMLQGGRLNEASKLLQVVSELIFNQPIPLATSLSEYNQQLEIFWNLIQQKAGQQSIKLESLANKSLETIKNFSLSEDIDGVAYRYALSKLNAFVVLGTDYSRFQSDYALSLYNPETGTGKFTAEWIEDRAAMLSWKLQLNTEDFPSSIANPYHDSPNVYFKDMASGEEIVLGNPPMGQLDRRFVLFGSSDGDVLNGGAQDDRFYGMEGNDSLNGAGGSDYLEGGGGDDEISAEDGNDKAVGGMGDDRIDGGDGNDRVYGDATDSSADIGGKDTLIGGAGDDALYGGGESDILYGDGESARDTGGFLGLSAGDDKLYGGAGNDYLYGGAGKDLLSGDGGNDDLVGGEGEDTLLGGSGDDSLDGILDNGSADILDGGDGFDTYQAGEGDTIRDSDGKGVVYLNGKQLSFATRKKGETTWTDSAGNTYALSGGNLLVNDPLTIENFNDGDLGIYLDEEEDPNDPNRHPTAPG
ncbi:MAG: calcium-binding protein, partial [Deltaproteobacteria bacterium]|nr:calcium-binding protein [Deltaproteobacteria bacterium]